MRILYALTFYNKVCILKSVQGTHYTDTLVSYSRAFVDAAVEYKCVPLLHGFKNEIVLNSAGRANTYSFITDFDGLTPRDSTGYAIHIVQPNECTAGFYGLSLENFCICAVEIF